MDDNLVCLAWGIFMISYILFIGWAMDEKFRTLGSLIRDFIWRKNDK